MIEDSYRGFLAIDMETALRVKVSWARILMKIEGKERPSVFNILERARSLELQIWWEILPKSIVVYPSKARKFSFKRRGRKVMAQHVLANMHRLPQKFKMMKVRERRLIVCACVRGSEAKS